MRIFPMHHLHIAMDYARIWLIVELYIPHGAAFGFVYSYLLICYADPSPQKNNNSAEGELIFVVIVIVVIIIVIFLTDRCFYYSCICHALTFAFHRYI